MTVAIPLSRSLVTLVDDEDAALVHSAGPWCFKPRSDGNGGYAITTNPTVYLHRFLMEPPDGLVVDHINGDGLDNRRSANLRVVTQSTNLLNRHPERRGIGVSTERTARRDSTTGVRNVIWLPKKNRYWVRLQRFGQRPVYSKYFRTLDEAATAAELARSIHYGDQQAAL